METPTVCKCGEALLWLACTIRGTAIAICTECLLVHDGDKIIDITKEPKISFRSNRNTGIPSQENNPKNSQNST